MSDLFDGTEDVDTSDNSGPTDPSTTGVSLDSARPTVRAWILKPAIKYGTAAMAGYLAGSVL